MAMGIDYNIPIVKETTEEKKMSYVVYNKETTVLLPVNTKHYSTEGAAKSALTRAVNSGKVSREDYAIAPSAEFFENIELQVTKVNMMSKKEFTQPANTPHCCDPSYETFWSM